MLLRNRLVLIFGVASMALTAVVAVPMVVIWQLGETQLQAARGDVQAAEWGRALTDAVVPYQLAGSRIGAMPELKAALGRGDRAGADRLLAGLIAAEPGEPGQRLRRMDVIAPDGRLVASSDGQRTEAPLMDSHGLGERTAAGSSVLGLEVGPDGRMLLVSTYRLGDGLFASVGGGFAAAVRALAKPGMRQLYLLDRNDVLEQSSDPGGWPAIAAARNRASSGTAAIRRGNQRFSVISTPVLDSTGLRIGTLVMEHDVTLEAQRRSLVLLMTGSVAALVFAALCLAIYGYARSALDPLTEITRVIRAMAAGDALASADLPPSKDEVGAISAAIEVFRHNAIALERVETRQMLDLAQQQRLIRREMARLAGTLEAPAREVMLGDLRGIEAEVQANPKDGSGSALATAFRQMANRVVAQHRNLAELLAERTRDLESVRQALAERAQLVRLREELDVARRLQVSSLPAVFPPYPERRDLEIFAAMKPAKEVGGDFYDFTLIDHDRFALMIGDASGKGVAAAIFIAMGRSLLRSALARGASPAQALGVANSALAVENHTMMFATVFVAIVDLRTGWMTYASAGHNPPYRVRAGAAPEVLSQSKGIALGILDEAEYEDVELRLHPGDGLLLFTDGVTEANDAALTLFGDDRLEQVVAASAGADPVDAVTTVQAAVDAFAGEAEQADDITVLSFRFHGGGPDTDLAQAVPISAPLSVGSRT